MDADSPWEEDPHVDHILEAEWSKITSEFTNSGYREGIIAGEEDFLQPGFDAGFADIGVPLGRELGNLRGIVAAVGSFLNSQKPDTVEREELRSISSILSSIQFSDIAPHDLEAEQHAKEHLGFDDPPVVNSTELETNVKQKRRTIEGVAELKEKLAALSAKLGLPVLAQLQANPL